MAINRREVLDKYDGHCAYCGKMIDLKTMQVDHLQPKCLGGTDDFENLMPSCRRCNHYKRASTLENFRMSLSGLLSRLQKIYIYKVARDYGLVQEVKWSGKFYFERLRTEETVVVNLRRESYDVYIGRGSKWGNPFKIGRDGTREEVIKKYREWIILQPQLIEELTILKGKRLGCYCKPLACHGDVLIELIDKFVLSAIGERSGRVCNYINKELYNSMIEERNENRAKEWEV